MIINHLWVKLGEYALEHQWLKTTTEGCDSNCNAIVERCNKKLNQGMRTLLLHATGGRLYYEELWDVAMDHIHDLVNNSPEAGDKLPCRGLGVTVLVSMIWSALVHW